MAWTFYNSSGEAMIEDGAMTIANNTNNRVVTATGADPASLNGEANLTFDGTTLTIAGQIAFPASQSANAGANVLDDYEEGTFTPTLHDNSNSDSESVAYSMQVGHYVKIGRIVHCQLAMTVSDLGSLTTSEIAKVAGLPFTSSSTTSNYATIYCGYGDSLALATAGDTVGGYVEINATHISLRSWTATGGVVGMTVAQYSVNGFVMIACSYQV
jgi:hypothetical protein